MSAYGAWHQALRELTSDEQRFASWREQRYAFAYQIGVLLTEAHPPCPAVSGPALYGVYLAGTGLCYVGQTQDARRRLRDLPIGESHYLAVTAPPEIWTRIVVVQWAELLDAALPRMSLGDAGRRSNTFCTANSIRWSIAVRERLTAGTASVGLRTAGRRVLSARQQSSRISSPRSLLAGRNLPRHQPAATPPTIANTAGSCFLRR
jgi:hypothetical protein